MKPPRYPTWLIAIPLLMMSFLTQAASLSATSLTVTIGQSTVVQVQNIKGKATLSNSNPGVAQARMKLSESSASIIVTGVSEGNAILTLKDRSGSQSVSVTVAPAMSLTPSSVTLLVNQSGTIQVNHASGEPRLSNSNAEVVTAALVNGSIQLTAKSPGSSLLTVRDNFSIVTASITVDAGPTSPGSAIPNGRLLASNCFQCHGTNGSGGFDTLMGKSDLYSELQEYLNGGENPNGIMAAHIKGYTLEQLQAIADYLANPQ